MYATVHHVARRPGRQAFTLDADGVPGVLLSPDLQPTRVALDDVRAPHPGLVYDQDGIEFIEHSSAVRVDTPNGPWVEPYEAELRALLEARLGVREVVVFDHTVRIDDPGALRRPARNVHGDYSPRGAQRRLLDLLGSERACDWSAGHYAFINLWRPLAHPVQSAPLGFVHPATVRPEDWLSIDLIYPDRRGEIRGLVHHPRHRWLYRSEMTPSELVLFRIYDNRGAPMVPHSALDLDAPASGPARQSVESRTLVRW